MRRIALALAALPLVMLSLSACTPAPPDTSVAEQRFDHMQKLPLTVSKVELQHSMQPPPEQGRRVDTLTNPALVTMLERWKAARLKPAHSAGEAIITIDRAEIIETRPHLAPGVSDLMKRQPKDLYAGAIEGTLRLILETEDGSTRRSVITANAARRLSLPANATLAQREAEWTALAQRLIADFDAEVERRLGEEGWIVGVEIDRGPEPASPYFEQGGVQSRDILSAP
ncbi:MAG: hypothetical protein Alpg2KO_31090 [Alphaproteobacteria bacterium]